MEEGTIGHIRVAGNPSTISSAQPSILLLSCHVMSSYINMDHMIEGKGREGKRMDGWMDGWMVSK